MTAYRPLESRCAWGVASFAVCSRRTSGSGVWSIRAAVRTSSARGWATETSRGVRSCSSNSVARTFGSSWNLLRMMPLSSTFAIATMVMPWWWAMYARTIAQRAPAGSRLRV